MRSSMQYNEHLRLSALEARLYREWCQRHNISYSHLLILDLLYQYEEGVDGTFICDTLLVYKQTLTGLLKFLEKKEYIAWNQCKKDKRKKVISLTAQGRQYVESILNDLYEKEDSAFNCLNAEEKTMFNKLYQKLVTSLQEELEEKEDN